MPTPSTRTMSRWAANSGRITCTRTGRVRSSPDNDLRHLAKRRAARVRHTMRIRPQEVGYFAPPQPAKWANRCAGGRRCGTRRSVRGTGRAGVSHRLRWLDWTSCSGRAIDRGHDFQGCACRHSRGTIMAHMPLGLGHHAALTGDVTQNRWVGARSAMALEEEPWLWVRTAVRRVDGIAAEKRSFSRPLQVQRHHLAVGRSARPPRRDQAADRARQHVSDVVMNERGIAGYRDLQLRTLASITDTGPDRIVKVIPATRHSNTMAPSDQYPMGGGGLQWTLVRPCDFLVAMSVDENGIACLANGYSGFLGESASYEVRARIARYLDQA